MEKDSESHQGSGEGRCLGSQAPGRVRGGGIGGVTLPWEDLRSRGWMLSGDVWVGDWFLGL